MRKLRVKAVISTVLLLACLYIAVTGVILHFAQTGLIMGIPRFTIRNTHGICAIVMTCAVVVHFLLNLRVYRQEIRALKRKTTDTPAGEDTSHE